MSSKKEGATNYLKHWWTQWDACWEFPVGFGGGEILDILDRSYFSGGKKMKIRMTVGSGEERRKGNAVTLFDYIYPVKASLVAQLVKSLPAMWETWIPSLGWEDPLEKETATHSSILAWRIPWTPCVTESDMTEWLSLLLSFHPAKRA